MNKQLVIGILVGAVVATAAGAFAIRETRPQVATVVSVEPITLGMEQEYVTVTSVIPRQDPNAPQVANVVNTQPIVTPGRMREVCEDHVVTHQVPVKDEHQIAGTASGAVIGGLLGNQVGGGNGKKAATAIGAIVGGVVGKNVQANRQRNQTYQTTEQVCHNVQDPDQTTGYNVTVEIAGQTQTLDMSYRPQGTLPVVNGMVITDKNEIQRLKNNVRPTVYDVSYQHNGMLQVVQMNSAPNVGDKFPIEQGRVLTTQEELASLQARSNSVVAYRVLYQNDNELGEVRMAQPPTSNILTLKNGRPVITTAMAQ